jgi:restriction endonuclease Mrr
MEQFLAKLIDWRDFEKFVADLYRDSDELRVEHDVTLVGKSGARRQVDVLVHRRSKLHEDKFIVECKRWKDPVQRSRIDILAASVRDLNANRGAIFTTKGYEEGAVGYAKDQGIDIFVVRDLREDEWGEPGRHVLLYWAPLTTPALPRGC